MVANLGQIVPVDPAGAPRIQTKLVHVDSQPIQYLLELKCYEWNCHETAETPLFNDFHDCHDHAQNIMGWGKPKSKPWAHSRCPQHKWDFGNER